MSAGYEFAEQKHLNAAPPIVPQPAHHTAVRANRAIAKVALILVTLSTFQRILRDADLGGAGWRQGDWLINSSAGPVRHAWFGDAVLLFADLFNVNPVTIILALQAVLVAFVMAAFWIALRRTGWSTPLVLIAISPAALLFWFNDPIGALRKELLVFAAMSVVLLAPRSRLALAFAAAVFAIGVTAHEGLVLFLPVFLVAFWLIWSSGGSGRAALVAAIFCTLTALISLVYMAMHSYVADTSAICDALVERGAGGGICSGAIGYLSNTLEFAVEGRSTTSWSEIWRFLGCSFLTLITFSLVWPDARVRIRVGIGFIFALLLFLPLTVVASDWGRWLNYAAMSVLFLLLLKAGLDGPSKRTNMPHRLVFWGVLLLNGVWVLPHSVEFAGPEAILPELAGDLYRAFTRD